VIGFKDSWPQKFDELFEIDRARIFTNIVKKLSGIAGAMGYQKGFNCREIELVDIFNL
jgi:hypothetical protein